MGLRDYHTVILLYTTIHLHEESKTIVVAKAPGGNATPTKVSFPMHFLFLFSMVQEDREIEENELISSGE